MSTRNGKKFAEPRGWALKWVLDEAEAQALAVEQQKPEHGNKEKFAEPHGWAMKWDGFALADADKEQKD